MAIYKGNTKIVKLYKGTTQIVKRYKGTQLIYSALPSEFQEVEYIESSGTQYIDTNFVPTLNSEIFVKFNYGTAISSNQMLFGSKSYSSHYYQCFKGSNDRFSIAFGCSSSSDFTNLYSTDYYNLDVELKVNNSGFSINNTLYSWSVTPSEIGYSTLSIFARHYETYDLFGSYKLYSFKIYDNNILVRDFVPCYRKADNVAGLYDLVNGVFYTNAGTGTFIVGGNV